MRLYSAYINMKAAKEAGSGFHPDMAVQKIYQDGKELYELTQLEEKDDKDIDDAREKQEIPAIVKEEEEEIRDIEQVANKAFRIIRDSMLLLHTQLDELKKLVKQDEILKHSGFPIEVADQLEEMLKNDIGTIIAHLREIQKDIDSEKADDGSN